MANRLYHADITVLGAGPAGVAAALALHKAGLTVRLVGQAAGADMKIGEFLPASIGRLFRALDLGGVEDALPADTYLKCSAKVSAWGSDAWTYQDSLRDPEGGGWHILRHRFEQVLLERAKARGIPFHAAKLLEVADNGAEYRVRAQGADGVIDVQSPRLIDATGRHAWLVRRVASAPRRGNTQMAVAGWFSDPDEPVEQVTHVKSVRNGWWYTAPLPGQKRVVAFHGLPDSVSAYFRNPDRFVADARHSGLENALADAAQILSPLQSCDASAGLSPKVAGKRWVAIGDAALSFDPLSSQGLHFAFYSAVMARDAICKALSARDLQGGYDAMEIYCSQFSEVFKTNQRTRYMFYSEEKRYLESGYWIEQRSSF